MESTRLAGEDEIEEVEGLDEEFLHHVGRGSDLLLAGDLDGALHSLGRAKQLRARDPKVLGLIGQVTYKLGRFGESADAYTQLVDQNPADAAARVNLGLADLKAGRYPEAVRQLEIALDLNPEHRKARGYLGLAWLEQGDLARARDCFQKAGSEQMVARCDELIRVVRTPPPTPIDGGIEEVEPEPELDDQTGLETKSGQRPEARPPPLPLPLPVVRANGRTAPPPEPAHAPEPSRPPELQVRTPEPSRPPELQVRTPESSRPPVAPRGVLAGFEDLHLIGSEPPAPFSREGGLLSVAVRNQVLVRGLGLLAVIGNVQLTPELKRFRGQTTDKRFGDGQKRVLRASGKGTLVFRAPEGHLSPLDLNDESGYFREDVVFGFEETVTFENGRVTSSNLQDVDLVHLRGTGRALLLTRGRVGALDVSPEKPARVPALALVGWTGGLTPRLVPLAQGVAGGLPERAEPATMELTGEGRVLLDEGAGG